MLSHIKGTPIFMLNSSKYYIFVKKNKYSIKFFQKGYRTPLKFALGEGIFFHIQVKARMIFLNTHAEVRLMFDN